MTRATLRIAHQLQLQKVKGQGHRPTNADTQNVPYLPDGKAYELQSLCADEGRRPASAASAEALNFDLRTSKIDRFMPCPVDHLNNLHQNRFVRFPDVVFTILVTDK